jgi:hypothetical protein
MPTNVRIIHAHDFIKATATGALDLETSKKLLLELASASAHLDDYHIILDTRRAQSELAGIDLWHLVSELGKLRMAFSPKTAVLCPRERLDYGEFFALCAESRGFEVRAFTSYEEAMEWLLAKRT